MQLCFGCMNEYDAAGGVCPLCGYDNNSEKAASNCLAPGTFLAGRYLIGRVLGSGGFGITYIGRDSTLKKRVTIKEYLPSELACRSSDGINVECTAPDKKEKFQRGIVKTIEESNVLARLNSLEGVVSVYNCIEANGTVYIILEYLSGETLNDVLEKSGRLNFDESIKLLTPVLEALDTIHAEGVIHRDISPENIFVCDDGSVKLIDFGAATSENNGRNTKTVTLKRGFAPREQYSLSGIQGSFTDVYATAATLYKMLSGVVPRESLEREQNDDLMPLSCHGVEIPDYAENALRRAMTVNWSKRTSTAGEFLRGLTDPYFYPDEDDDSDVKVFGGGLSVPETLSEESGEPEEEKPESNKKLIAGIAIAIAVTLAVCAAVIAFVFHDRTITVDSGECGDNIEWKLKNDGTFIVDGKGEMTDFEIGKAPWNASAEKIKYVEISDDITSVGSYAFYSCSNMIHLVLGDDIIRIGDCAFFGCSSLPEVILPVAVRSIGVKSFGNCRNLCLIHMPEQLEMGGIVSNAFTGCEKLVICAASKNTGAYDFAADSAVPFSLCSGYHSEAVSKVGDDGSKDSTVIVADSKEASGVCGDSITWVLDEGSGLLTVKGTGVLTDDWKILNAPITGFNADATDTAMPLGYHTDYVTSVFVESGITAIDTGAFRNFRRAKSITLPDTVTQIGDYAFENCRALDIFIFPAEIETIGKGLFRGCSALTSAELPAVVTEIPEYTYSGCSALREYIFPETVTAIGKGAFEGCSGFTQISIPETVTKLGEYAFSGCSSLTSCSIPTTVQALPAGVFSGCGFVSFQVPYGIEMIGEYAFSDCKMLHNVQISSTVNLIGQYAFSNCKSLTGVVVPESVTTLGIGAFSGCSRLEYVHIPVTCKGIGENIVNGTSAHICNISRSITTNTPRTYAMRNGISYTHCNGH